MTSLIILIPTMIGIMLVGALGALYFKKASAHLHGPLSKLLTNWTFIWTFGLATFLYVASAAGYVALLRLEPLSILYPMTSITYIWVALLSWWLLKEHMGKGKLVGIGLIVAGIILLTI